MLDRARTVPSTYWAVSLSWSHLDSVLATWCFDVLDRNYCIFHEILGRFDCHAISSLDGSARPPVVLIIFAARSFQAYGQMCPTRAIRCSPFCWCASLFSESCDLTTFAGCHYMTLKELTKPSIREPTSGYSI